MSWRTIVDQAYARGREGSRPRYEPPAAAERLERAERGLTGTLPGELRSLLLEADGIMDLIHVDGNWIENMWLIWPVEVLRERNLELRRQLGEGRFPEGALAFAGAGADGVVFAFDLAAHESGVLAWDPLTAECTAKAQSLREFLPGWIAGEISV